MEAILSAAADIIAERGYEATTLTEVAQRAGTSIGSLYQYFPDKDAIAAALAKRYGADIADLWSDWADGLGSTTNAALADRLTELVLDFHDRNPAYLALISGSERYHHEAGDRDRLRLRVARLLEPRLLRRDGARALLVADMIVQAVKTFGRAGGRNPSPDLVAEYRLMLSTYLKAVLAPDR